MSKIFFHNSIQGRLCGISRAFRLQKAMSLYSSSSGNDIVNTTLPEGFPSLAEIESSTLFNFQTQLKPLPIPSLDSTLSKLKGFIKALEAPNNNALSEVDDLITKFQKEEGPILQTLLEARANKKKTSFGWLYEWWNDYAYLQDRSPLVFYVSYFYAFKDNLFSPFLSDVKNDIEKQCRIAALIASASIRFKEKIISGSLEPDKHNSTPLCSHMYKYMFNACRIPRKPYDTTLVFDVKKNNHLIVLYKDTYYKIDGHHSSSNSLRPWGQIERYSELFSF